MVNSSFFNSVKTKNLLLDSFSIRDGKNLFKMTCDFEIAKYVPGAYVKSLEQAYENIVFYRKYNGKGDFYIAIRIWTPTEKATLAGLIIATRPEKEIGIKSLEVAYLMGSDFRGKGYMQEAMESFIPLTKEMGYKQLIFEIIEDNEESIQIVENLGAQLIEIIDKTEYLQRTKLYILNLNQM